VRQARRDSRASSNHEGYWYNGAIQREETGASAKGRGGRAAARTKQKEGGGQAKEGRRRGGKTRVHP